MTQGGGEGDRATQKYILGGAASSSTQERLALYTPFMENDTSFTFLQ